MFFYERLPAGNDNIKCLYLFIVLIKKNFNLINGTNLLFYYNRKINIYKAI